MPLVTEINSFTRITKKGHVHVTLGYAKTMTGKICFSFKHICVEKFNDDEQEKRTLI